MPNFTAKDEELPSQNQRVHSVTTQGQGSRSRGLTNFGTERTTFAVHCPARVAASYFYLFILFIITPDGSQTYTKQ